MKLSSRLITPCILLVCSLMLFSCAPSGTSTYYSREEDIMEAMESMPSHGEEDMDEPVQTTLPPEVGDQVAAIKSAGSAPPPELEELVKAMESMPSHEEEN